MRRLLSRLVPRRLRTPLEIAWSALAPLPQKQYRSRDRGVGTNEVLSTTPPIVHVGHWMEPGGRFMFCMDDIAEALRDRPAWFLYSWWWHIADPSHVALVVRYERQHIRAHPRHRFIHLCNSHEQLEGFQAAGLDAILCSHNAFIDERIFRPLAGVAREFDAVYDARLAGYKRHHLAGDVTSLALIHAPDLEDASGDGGRRSGPVCRTRGV